MNPVPLYLRPKFPAFFKRSDQAVSGTTFATDTDLTLLVSPNTRYIMRLSLFVSLDSSDFKYQFLVPSNPRTVLIKHVNNIATSTTPITRALAIEGGVSYSVGAVSYVHVDAEIYLFSTTGGRFSLQYAANSGNGTVTALSNSYLEYFIA